jgi:hypothetical protein
MYLTRSTCRGTYAFYVFEAAYSNKAEYGTYESKSCLELVPELRPPRCYFLPFSANTLKVQYLSITRPPHAAIWNKQLQSLTVRLSHKHHLNWV